MNGIIYCYTNLINGKQYVGQSRQFNKRHKKHIFDADSGSPLTFHSALRKYGIHNFSHCVLETCEPAQLHEREIYWIKTLHTFLGDPQCHGYNMTSGGDGPASISEETRMKLSNASKKRQKTKHSDQTKQKISLSLTGRTGTFTGKQHTADARAKMSKFQKGKIVSDETRHKMSLSKKSIRFTDEHRRNISKAKIGQLLSKETRTKMSKTKQQTTLGIQNPFFGKHHSTATKEYLSNQKGQRWTITYPDGQQATVVSLKRFCHEHGLDNTAMGRVAKGKAIHHKRYQCCHLEILDK